MPCRFPTPPSRHRHRPSFAPGLAWLLLLAAIPVFAAKPEPPLRIPLENFGFQPLPAQFLLNGSSMLTLHYVDDKHLLLTFVVHRLIPRLPDEPEDDQDRIVDAVLLELPTGRALARTSWHLHDHAQYLWNLGHGHFLLRVRDTLTTFAPLANLATREPFAQQPFLVSAERRLAALILSPDADLLIIETVKRIPPTPRPKTPDLRTHSAPIPAADRKRSRPDQLLPHPFAAMTVARSRSDPPAPSKPQEPATSPPPPPAISPSSIRDISTGPSTSTPTPARPTNSPPSTPPARPAPLFVSHSEFIAFGCRTGQTRQQLGGFNMRGEEMWEQGLFGDFIAPSIAYAPAGGRFALSRIMLHSSFIADQPISADQVSDQTVVVYQTGTGKQLLRADCSPVERAGQNFALSPNGLALAVVHADAIEIYTLPPLTTKDESDLKLARSIAPPENNLPVHFTGQATPLRQMPTPPNPAPSNAASAPQPPRMLTATTGQPPRSDSTRPQARYQSQAPAARNPPHHPPPTHPRRHPTRAAPHPTHPLHPARRQAPPARSKRHTPIETGQPRSPIASPSKKCHSNPDRSQRNPSIS